MFNHLPKTALLITLLSFSCSKRKHGHESTFDSTSQVKHPIIDSTPQIASKDSIVQQDDNTLYVKTWTETLDTEMPDYLYKLDSAAQYSDASFSEELGMASASYYEKKPFEFLKYLADHPKSNLEKRFTNELSASISVFQGEGRAEELKKVISRLNAEIAKMDIDSIGKNYLRTKMIKRIDPRRFD